MMTGFERYTKKTRRASFLEEMEQVVPWGESAISTPRAAMDSSICGVKCNPAVGAATDPRSRAKTV